MKGYVMFIWFKPDPCDLMYRQVLFDVLSKRLQTTAIEKQCHQVVFCVLIEFCSFRQSTIEKKLIHQINISYPRIDKILKKKKY